MNRGRYRLTVTPGAPRTDPWPDDRLKAAGECLVLHRELVLPSQEAGCCYCLATFPVSAIRQWTDGSRRAGQTALCPRCGVDGVLPDGAGFPLIPLFLQAMRARWFRSVDERAGRG